MRNVILPFFLAITGCQAWNWDGPVSTRSYTLLSAGVSPRPTPAPVLHVRDAVGGQVCGYVGGMNCKFVRIKFTDRD
jgi:hypothetical protein